MVQAVGASATVNQSTDPAAAAAGLEARLVRYQKQLSECVNCDSSKTASGKAEIESISGKISEVRDRIARIAESRTVRTLTDTIKNGTNSSANTVPPEKNDRGPEPSIGSTSIGSTSIGRVIGSLLNTTA